MIFGNKTDFSTRDLETLSNSQLRVREKVIKMAFILLNYCIVSIFWALEKKEEEN